MTKGIFRSAAAFGLIAVLGATAACDRHDDDDHIHNVEFHILDRSVTPHEVIAIWTEDAGWDTEHLLTMSHADHEERTRVSLGARIFDRGGSEIDLGDEYGFRYGVASDPDGVIDMDYADDVLFHGDHVHIYSDNDTRPTGSAEIVFALWHVDHSDAQTDEITITVTD